MRAVWVDGPRNEAWAELWRRLLVAVIRRLEEEDARNEDARSEYNLIAERSPDASPGNG
jgi:hypothetical protein